MASHWEVHRLVSDEMDNVRLDGLGREISLVREERCDIIGGLLMVSARSTTDDSSDGNIPYSPLHER